MSNWQTTPRAEEDLIECARWIRADNPPAARRFLETAFVTFERLGKFPESGPAARLKNSQLAGIRFCVLPPPFNRWLIFYRIGKNGMEILQVVYGTQNWRRNPASFFV